MVTYLPVADQVALAVRERPESAVIGQGEAVTAIAQVPDPVTQTVTLDGLFTVLNQLCHFFLLVSA